MTAERDRYWAGNEPVSSFRGTYDFLSNFYRAPVTSPEDGLTYPTCEHAFQAAKAGDIRIRTGIMQLPTPGDAKRAGRLVALRPDWEEVKKLIMFRLVLDKFLQNPDLAEKLDATGDRLLIEGNTWGDDYWGMVWNGGAWTGRNYLGQILMAVRMVLA